MAWLPPPHAQSPQLTPPPPPPPSPRLTWSTALVFYHRFFSRQSFVSHSHLEVSTVCLFLSCKVEETPKKITQVLQVARRAREVKKSEAGGEEGKWEGGNMDVKGQEFILMKDR